MSVRHGLVVKLQVLEPDKKSVRGVINDLVGLTEDFAVFRDRFGSLMVNTKNFVFSSDGMTLKEIVCQPHVIVVNEWNETIFTGPPWNEEEVGKFVMTVISQEALGGMS